MTNKLSLLSLLGQRPLHKRPSLNKSLLPLHKRPSLRKNLLPFHMRPSLRKNLLPFQMRPSLRKNLLPFHKRLSLNKSLQLSQMRLSLSKSQLPLFRRNLLLKWIRLEQTISLLLLLSGGFAIPVFHLFITQSINFL